MKHCRWFVRRKKRSVITVFHDYNTKEDYKKRGERTMNKTLIVLGAGIWGVMLLLRFVIDPKGTNSTTALQFLFILEIVAFIITVVGIIKRD